MYRFSGSFALLATLGLAVPVQAQWFEWVDEPTNVTCGLINAENVRLVLSDETGNLILVNGADRSLVSSSVDESGQVILDGQPVGFVEYARDADDRLRVFWVTNIGSLYSLNTDGEPLATETFPEEVLGDCDPCDAYWDIEADCDSTDDAGTSGTGTTDLSQQLGAALLQGLCGLGSGAGLIGVLFFGLTALRVVRPRA
ncbi:MAG TPA: hypothetical protein VM243_12815 [Phycisphaerae bacterium]|nr:hypothetical protein [Phycisphaerae bacterium]